MLQNIDDSLNSFALLGTQSFAQFRAPRHVAKYQRSNVGAIQGAEQVCPVTPDSAPSPDTLFEPLRSSPKWLVDKWAMGESPRQIANQAGMQVGTIYGLLQNMARAILQAVDKPVQEVRYPLRGKPIQYIDPIEPVADEDWEALR